MLTMYIRIVPDMDIIYVFSLFFYLQLHGRTREQRYTKKADWDYISDCVEAASPYPLLGNSYLYNNSCCLSVRLCRLHLEDGGS